MTTVKKELTKEKSIAFLANEIKYVLINKIKEKDSSYEYLSIEDLKNKSILLLSSKMQSYAILLHKLVSEPKDTEYEYSMLSNIYKEINS